ncbi:hypothetical protein [Chryseobacterium sp. AG363]|uniref:hypothetical protein n=1 Tax=Chryseobacterium sp. AG363 TaxID=2183997 RepID=UPI000E746137|nr:hypothetical protein [Chryseobacterium sp. AG363]RKE77848.1 hypothetical protein DEU39_3481 [Chryseobacterium sp. AG363]
MDLNEFKTQIKNKIFQSTNGFYYQFIPENTLRLKDNPHNAVHYEIKEQNGKFVLYHNYLLGTEPIVMEITDNKLNRLELTMTKIFSGDFIGTWIEQH